MTRAYTYAQALAHGFRVSDLDPFNKNSQVRQTLRDIDTQVVQPVGELVKEALATVVPNPLSLYLKFLDAQAKYQPLPAYLRTILAPHYGVDLARVRFATDVNTVHGQAITVGYDIYFPRSIDLDTPSYGHLHWMLHELEHVVQYERHGGVTPFLLKYAAQGLLQVLGTGSFDVHDNIELEKQAEDKADRIIAEVWESVRRRQN